VARVEAPLTKGSENDGFVLPNGGKLAVASNAGVRRHNAAIELFGDAPATGDATLSLVVQHPLARPAHVWIPHLAPDDRHVIGDWVFRSPAIVLADDDLAIALVVDVDDVALLAGTGLRAWLDYDHPRSTITLAAGNYRHQGHVFFARERAQLAQPTPVSLRLHVVTSTSQEDRENPYGLAARFCWQRWGRPNHARVVPPPIDTHLGRIVRWAFSHEQGWEASVWQNVEGIGGAPVFIVDVNRHPSVPPEQRTWRERRSIWNQAWFSTQRCANGLLRHARHTRDRDLAERARQMTEVALAAPRRDGLFPAVLRCEDDGTWRWSNSDRRPPSTSEDACHVVDAAFTSRMLLEWHGLTSEARARDHVLGFAARLVRLQRPSGAFPGWVEPDGRIPSELAEGPESAMSASLLFELATIDVSFTAPALRALPFLEGVLSEGRWEDFETYYSCAPWGAPDLLGKRVPRNGVFKQNTLSIAWTAEAFHLAWRATGEEPYRRLARRALDELSLYQAVWDPPFLPAPAHGGFGVMNADSEWNDARQSLFAPLYLEIGTATNDAELVERGVSALRASFSMAYAPENAALARAYEKRFPSFGPETYGFMMENQGHDPAQPIGTFTIYTWGNGSALAAVATVRDRFPDIAKAHGFA